MATDRSQQFSAQNLSTHSPFNIFGKLRLMLVAGLLLLPQLLPRDYRIAERHHRERVRAGACGCYLAATNSHAILRMQVLRLPGIAVGQQGATLLLRQTIVELFVVGQGLRLIENMHNACHVIVD